ncbi:MAG TPA: hypothetical protein VF553_15110 [Pyrinomonadaceae bacterium]
MTSRLMLPALLGLLCFTAFAPSTPAQNIEPERWENGVTEAWWVDGETVSKEELAAARSLWKAIEDENRAVSNEWAGDYFIGSDTHGSYLRFSREKGFVLAQVDKCQARLMGLSYGKVIVTPTLVQLLPEHGARSTHTHAAHGQATASKYIPVVWRGSHHLIPETEMADFGDYIVGLGKYNAWVRDGFMYGESVEFFSKLESESAGGEGQTIVPPGYERYLKKPIDAKIVKVGTGHRRVNRENEWWDELIIPVSLNVGSAEGVKSGMIFRLIGTRGFGGFGESVEVRSVGLHASGGVVVRTIRKSPCVKYQETDDCANPEYERLVTGWAVTTDPFK